MSLQERNLFGQQFDALLVDVTDLKQFVNSIVDDLQAYGILA